MRKVSCYVHVAVVGSGKPEGVASHLEEGVRWFSAKPHGPVRCHTLCDGADHQPVTNMGGNRSWV